MTVLHDIAALAAIQHPVWLAIGSFDGVHRAHQILMDAVRREAARDNAEPVVVTFDPHPLKIVRPEGAPRLLTSTRHKLMLLERHGAATALVVKFTPEFARTPPETFIDTLIRAAHPLAGIAVGHRWEFGHRRSGNLALLEALGARHHFKVFELPAVTDADDLISSTRVRQAVLDGNLEHAASLLGRPFSLFGKVVHGDGRGKALGFPTANLANEGEILPPHGVYAGRCAAAGRIHACAVNIGTRPTVGGGPVTVEAHLIGFTGDLYARDLEIELLERIRGEMKFENMDQLRAQIQADVETASRLAP